MHLPHCTVSTDTAGRCVYYISFGYYVMFGLKIHIYKIHTENKRIQEVLRVRDK
jgi:hypothetical protein